MTGSAGPSWATGRRVAGFGLPRGLLGRLAGRVMAAVNRGQQHEVLALLEVGPGDRVLEVGYGPGVLAGLLLERTGAALVAGVDPSPEMRAQARRRTGGDGRADLRLGTADATGFPESSFDRVVSVNTVAAWPDLEAGLRELHRVTRPGGRVVIAWHGARAPSRVSRRLALPEERLDRLRDGLQRVFGNAGRHDLRAVVAFTAVRTGAAG